MIKQRADRFVASRLIPFYDFGRFHTAFTDWEEIDFVTVEIDYCSLVRRGDKSFIRFILTCPTREDALHFEGFAMAFGSIEDL